MKKILLATVAVVILASCSNNESEILKKPTNEIKFSNLNNKVTRVANDSSDDFQVYSKLTTGATAWYIDDVVDGTSPYLAQSGPYYWPAGTETLDFYAYAPAGSGTVTDSYSTPSLGIVYTVPSAANEDFTVAGPEIGLDKTAGSGTGTVEFVFFHMLSKVTIELELDATDLAAYTLDLTSATATFNVAYNEGQLDATLFNPATPDVTFTSPTASGTASYSGALNGGYSCMIMPQAATALTTSILLENVIIKKGTTVIFDNTYGDLSYEFDGSEISAGFKGGTHYTITITIKNDSHDDDGDEIFGPEIKFSATTTPWTPTSIGINLP